MSSAKDKTFNKSATVSSSRFGRPTAAIPEGVSLDAIAFRLSLTRRVFDLAQKDFCSAAGISPNTYNQYENGKKRPAIENAIALCDRYGLTLDWIYRGNTVGLSDVLSEAIKGLVAASNLSV